MSFEYQLAFKPSALKEWKKLGSPVREQFKKKLAERLINPRIQGDALSGLKNCYKIKLRSVGYRLVYEVDDKQVLVMVVAVGKRERGEIYATVRNRL